MSVVKGNIYLLTSLMVPCPVLLCHCGNLSFKSSSNGPGECRSVAECFCNMCTHIPDPFPCTRTGRKQTMPSCYSCVYIIASWHAAFNSCCLYTFTTVFFLIFFHWSWPGYSQQDLFLLTVSISQLRSNRSHDWSACSPFPEDWGSESS